MLELQNIINTIIDGNTLNILKQIPSESINMCITSPPYWGLRDYGTNPQIWGGDDNCQHEWQHTEPRRNRSEKDIKDENSKQATQSASSFNAIGGNVCIKCGAYKGELGSESHYNQYISNLMLIMNEVKRVLTKDGTCWINLGDTYSSVHSGGHKSTKSTVGANNPQAQEIKQNKKIELPDKCLCSIPDRFKIAMTDNNWICRNEIIWHKPNAMPSSVTDRFTVDYEKLFFFTKNKKYYFDNDSVREPLQDITKQRDKYTRETKNGKTSNKTEYSVDHLHDCKSNEKGRNKRCVWSINTKPFKEAHFATYPEELIDAPIKAGCPENGIVLDIFMGSGTTGLVAKKLNKNYIGIELNSEYIKIAQNRINTYLQNNPNPQTIDL